MATYNISVPEKNLQQSFGLPNPNQISDLAKIKKQYGSIISECSKNSNVPEELIVTMIYLLSNGENHEFYASNDSKNGVRMPLVRMGVFSLSNMTARIVLHNEIFKNRLNDAERAYLNKYGNSWVQLYIQKERPKATELSVNKWWQLGNAVNILAISDRACYTSFGFNLMSPELAIAIGTIQIGQAWDFWAEITNKPLSSVILSMVFPYDYNYSTQGSQPFNTSFLLDVMRKNNIKNFDSDFALSKLPLAGRGKSKKNIDVISTSIYYPINPKWMYMRKVGEALPDTIYEVGADSYVMSALSKGGVLDTIINKQV